MEAMRATIEGYRSIRNQFSYSGEAVKTSSKSEAYYYEMMLNYFQRAGRAREEGSYLIGHSCLSPKEIFFAMDLVPLLFELYSMMEAIFRGDVRPYLEAADAYGIPMEICSAHRNMVGITLNNLLPPPDLLVSPSETCDPLIKSWEFLADFCQRPSFFLDIPLRYTEQSVSYFQIQLEKLITFLEDNTGRKMDYARLEEVVELSRQANCLYREVNELRKATPSPMHGSEYWRHLMAHFMLDGTPECVEYFRLVRDELKDRVAKGKGVVSEERYRIAWLQGVPVYGMKLLDWMEKEFGAVMVLDQFTICSDYDMNPQKPLESLARKAFTEICRNAFCGPMDESVDFFVEVARNYNLDAAVFFAHLGCTPGCSQSRLFKDALKHKLGIPTLVIDGDTLDPSVVPLEEVQGKLEGFFETLEECTV